MKKTNMNSKVGAWMLQKRKEAGLSQQEVADRMGHTRTAVHYWESGKRTIYASHLMEFCKALNIEPIEMVYALFYDEDEETTK